MGPVSQHNLTIAPAFYVTQVDLCGPFDSYAPHNKRKTVKIWLTVFCCATTSTTSTKTMDDYGISSFIQGSYFVTLYGQLIKGCHDTKFCDMQQKLHRDVKVDFEICPVGGPFHGKVERKIKEVKLSIEKIAHNQRLSLLQ